MFRIRFAAAVLVLFAVALGLRADAPKKATKDRLVGKWEPMSERTSVIEFTKDGKVKVTGEKDGKKAEIGGTYALDGDTIQLTMKFPDRGERSHKVKIKELTDKKLITEDEMGRVEEFRRK
jgi:uncharacterized protein (TIGR03066 family)